MIMTDISTDATLKVITTMLSGIKGSGRSTRIVEIGIGYITRNKHSPVFIIQYKKSDLGLYAEEIYANLNDEIRYNIMIINSDHLDKLNINLEKKLPNIPRLQAHEDKEGNYIIKEFYVVKP